MQQSSTDLVMPDKGDAREFSIGPFSRQEIADYCQRQGDTNAFHTDPKVAQWLFSRVRPMPEGSVLVPGMQIIDEFPHLTIAWLGHNTMFSGIRRLSIHAPALCGEEMKAALAITRRVSAKGKEGPRVFFFELDAIIRIEGLPRPVLTSRFRMCTPQL